jgi:hypothetical protein
MGTDDGLASPRLGQDPAGHLTKRTSIGGRGSLNGDDGVTAIAVDDVHGHAILADGVRGDALRTLDDVA